MSEQTTLVIARTRLSSLWNWVRTHPVAAILLLLFISEGAYKLGVELHFSQLRISAGLKILVQGYFLVHIWLKARSRLIPLVIIVGIFLIGQWAFQGPVEWFKNITILDEYLYLLMLLIYVNTLAWNQQNTTTVFKVFEWLIIINSAIIVLAFAFDLRPLSTYMGARWGYSGLIIKSGAATYIYSFALFYFAYRCLVNHQKKWGQLLLVLVSCFLLGTKAIILAVGLIGLFFFFAKGWFKKPIAAVALVIAILGAFLFLGPFSEQFLERLPVLSKIYQEEGIWSLITSYRNRLFVEEFLPIVSEQWNIANYLFGGCPDMHFRSQFELFDSLFFFGIVGSIYYFFVFYKNFVSFTWNKYSLGICVILLILALLSGNFFYNAVVAIYIVLVKLLFAQESLKEQDIQSKGT